MEAARDLPMNGPSLFVRYWAMLAALVSLPLLIVAALVGLSAWNDSRNAALERQRLEARGLALELERYALPAIDRLKLLSALPWGYPSADDRAFEAEARRIIVQHPLVDRIQRVSADRRVPVDYAQDGRRRELADEERKAVRRLAGDRNGAHAPEVVSRGARGAWSIIAPEPATDHAIVADLRIEVVGEWVRSARASRRRSGHRCARCADRASRDLLGRIATLASRARWLGACPLRGARRCGERRHARRARRRRDGGSVARPTMVRRVATHRAGGLDRRVAGARGAAQGAHRGRYQYRSAARYIPLISSRPTSTGRS